MAYPNATAATVQSRAGPTTVEQTDHFRLMRDFCAAPAAFIEEKMEE